MSWFTGIFSSGNSSSTQSTSPQNDIDRGKQMLQFYFNYIVSNYGYMGQFSDFALLYPGFVYLEQGLGSAIRFSSISHDDQQSAMIYLAQSRNGMPPLHTTPYFDALNHITTNPSIGSLLGKTAAATGEDIAAGAQKVGQAVISTGSTLLAIGPMLLIAGVVFFGFEFAKRGRV